MHHFLTRIAALALLATASASAAWKPLEADAPAYAKALAIVSEAEPYARFFATEKQMIRQPEDDSYLKARWTYFNMNLVVKPNLATPGESHAQFLKVCLDAGWLDPKDKNAFSVAALTAGKELLTGENRMKIQPDQIRGVLAIPYANYNGYQPKLDLYLPTARTKPLPCIVFIHGGGWGVHKRCWMEGYAKFAAREGFAAATIDYRLLPAVTPLECTHDAKAAVRFIRANAAKFGIDPDRIGACGDSAGAQLAAILATSADAPGLEGNGGNTGVSSRIQAAVGLATPALTGRRTWPIANNLPIPDWFDKISPYRHAGAGDAPMMFLHGMNDGLVSPDEPKDLMAKLEKSGVPCEIEFVPDAGHVFYMSEATAMKVINYFKSKLK